MNSQQPIIRDDDDEHRVVRFVPRNKDALRPSAPAPTPVQPANDLSRYETPRGSRESDGAESDDFRPRMLANLAALAFTALLVAAGIWLAVTLNDLRKTQDCVLSGRRDCAPIEMQGG